MAARLRTVESCPPGRFAGRGIVICAGGESLFVNAWVLVHVLRRVLHSQLPIEIWHLGRAEMSPRMANLLESLGARVIDARAILNEFPARIHDGWQLKVYALMHSAFRDVLLLDADQVPVVDPSVIFAWPEYADTGAVFWPDIIELSATNPIWDACGLPALRRRSFETGQIAIDKSRHWQALQVTLHLNEEAEFYYQLVYGDKDTFLVAWLAAGHDYALVGHLPIADMRCQFQHDFTGATIFQHRSGAKWRYAGEQYSIAGFIHEEACLAAIDELRKLWNGRIFNPPLRGLAARRLEGEIVAIRRFKLAQTAGPAQSLSFLAGNEIGEGRSRNIGNWCVADVDGRLVLQIIDGDRQTFAFAMTDSIRHWEGTTLFPPTAPVSLHAKDHEMNAARAGGIELVRDLVRAAETPHGWSPDALNMLAATFTLLARAEPTFLDALETFMAESVPPGAPSRTALREIVDHLRRTTIADTPPALPHDTQILANRSYYERN